MKQFIKNNPFIFAVIICSIVLFLISIVVCRFVLLSILKDDIELGIIPTTIVYSSLYLLAILFTNFSYIFFKKILKKRQFIIKTISFITNFLILCYQAFFCLFIIIASYFFAHPNLEDEFKPITSPESYIEAKESISCSKCIKHFPEVIPETARNVEFYKYINWFGAEGIFLGYDIDKDYIEKNVSKQNCKYYSLPNDNLRSREMHTMGVIEFDDGFINTDDYTFCVLNPLKTRKTSFIPQYGIAFRQDHIIYYYNKKD